MDASKQRFRRKNKRRSHHGRPVSSDRRVTETTSLDGRPSVSRAMDTVNSEQLQWARLLRGQMDGVQSSHLDFVTPLLGSFGLDGDQPNPITCSSPLPVEPPEKPSEQAVGMVGKMIPQTAKEPSNEHQSPASLSRLRLKLRALVEGGSDWSVVGPVGWELLEATGDPRCAAQLVEFAFLSGDLSTTGTVIDRLKKLPLEFYMFIHPAIREELVGKLWRSGECDKILPCILGYDQGSDLMPMERLLLFDVLSKRPDSTEAHMYFEQFKSPLRRAAGGGPGRAVGYSADRLNLTAGRVALSLGYKSTAKALLQEINQTSPEYEESLRLLIDQTVDDDDLAGSHYVELLLADRNTDDRLARLQVFIDATRGIGGFKDRNRPALNDILSDALNWVSKGPKEWASLSKLLSRNLDLIEVLPGLDAIFRTNAVAFHNQELDRALWQGPFTLATEGDGLPLFWSGVGALHNYCHEGPGAEGLLRQAKRLVETSRAKTSRPLPFFWRELLDAAIQWVTRTPSILEANRQRMLLQLRVARPSELLSSADVENYVETGATNDQQVIAGLREWTIAKGYHQLEARLIERSGRNRHFTNGELGRLWTLAQKVQRHDLAWRIASVAAARDCLSAGARHAWAISGEKRTTYPMLAFSDQVASACMEGLSKEGRKLAQATMVIGPLLPELIHWLDSSTSLSKVPYPSHDSIEATTDQFLNKLDWIGAKKRLRLVQQGQSVTSRRPFFAQVLPANQWSILLAALTDRLGVNAWQGRLAYLDEKVTDLIPRLASRQDLRRHSSRIARWLRDLTPVQRSAWQDLSRIARSSDLRNDLQLGASTTGGSTTLQSELAMFLCRLTTAIYQNHFMAIKSLQVMRVPVTQVRDLEGWILSEAYTEVRKELKSVVRMPVPSRLVKLIE